MKLVHWPLIGGLLHLVQRGGAWAGPQPAEAPPGCLLLLKYLAAALARVQSRGKNIPTCSLSMLLISFCYLVMDNQTEVKTVKTVHNFDVFLSVTF